MSADEGDQRARGHLPFSQGKSRSGFVQEQGSWQGVGFCAKQDEVQPQKVQLYIIAIILYIIHNNSAKYKFTFFII